jgi:hypothetical protein
MGTVIPQSPPELPPEDRRAEYRDMSIGRAPDEGKWPLAWRLRLIVGASLGSWALIILIAWLLFG